MRINTAQKLEPRERLLDAARVNFGRRGLAGCTDAELEAAAGVPTGSLEATYGSQERLFQALLRQEEERNLARLRAAVASSRDPGAQVRALLATGLRLVRELVGLVGATPDIYAEIRSAAGRSNRRQTRVIHQMLSDVLRRGWHSGHLVLDVPERAATSIQMRLMELQTEAILGVTRLRIQDEAAQVEQLLEGVVRFREGEPRAESTATSTHESRGERQRSHG